MDPIFATLLQKDDGDWIVPVSEVSIAVAREVRISPREAGAAPVGGSFRRSIMAGF
jgi:hypothetical protein